MDAPGDLKEAVREAIEADGDNRVSDLHVWAVGPDIYAAEIAVVTSEPQDPDHYWELLPGRLGLVHVTVEVHLCEECRDAAGAD
jgi:Co/Zn/Cd efflux system component